MITFGTSTQQGDTGATSASMIDAATEGEIKVWEMNTTTFHNPIRAFSIWPQTHMYFEIFDPMLDKVVDGPMKVNIKLVCRY
jgi:methionyl-tRNA formyltransferase